MNKSDLLISIITPTLNCEQTLERSILSVVNQTFRQYEYIIIDGGSGDGTVGLLNKYNENITYWQSMPDNGIYDAMNIGIAKSSGNWLYFLGADDSFSDKFVLEKIAEAVHGSDYTNIISGKINCSKGCRFFNPEPLRFFTGYPHQAVFFKRKWFDIYQYDLLYRIKADQHLMMKIFSNKNCNWITVDFLIANYHSGGYSSTNIDIEFSKDAMKNLKLYFPDLLINREVYKAMKKHAYNQIKYGNLCDGLLWLSKGGLSAKKLINVARCFMVRIKYVCKLA